MERGALDAPIDLAALTGLTAQRGAANAEDAVAESADIKRELVRLKLEKQAIEGLKFDKPSSDDSIFQMDASNNNGVEAQQVASTADTEPKVTSEGGEDTVDDSSLANTAPEVKAVRENQQELKKSIEKVTKLGSGSSLKGSAAMNVAMMLQKAQANAKPAARRTSSAGTPTRRSSARTRPSARSSARSHRNGSVTGVGRLRKSSLTKPLSKPS